MVFDTVVHVSNTSIPTPGYPAEEVAEEEGGGNIVGITLQPGWNLISFPVSMNAPSIDDILSDFSDTEIDAVFYDDAYSGMVLVPDEFEPLKGYWVHNNMSISFVIDESYLDPEIPSTPPSLRLYPGWNAIGHTAKAELPAEYALVTIDDFYNEVRGPWIPAERSYAQTGYNDRHGMSEGSRMDTDFFFMNKYEGYYVFVEDECMLA